MLKEIQYIKELVRKVLKDNPETRNSDHKLLLKVWETQGLKLTDEQKYFFTKCATPESITRARREIQEAGYYKATNNQGRLLEREKMQDYYKKL